MNTVIANQFGQVQGELSRTGLVLTVDAETPRRDSVRLTALLDSCEQIVYLLAVLRAVERRINQFQLRDSVVFEAGIQGDENSAARPVSFEADLFEANSDSKRKVYGRFPNFLVYEQLEQGRLRVFLAARDEQRWVARFDLHPGEVQAFQTLAERALFCVPRIDLLLRDELSLAVALGVSRKGVVFDVQTPTWQSHFGIAKAHNVATLGVFLERALNGAKAAPLHFDTGRRNETVRAFGAPEELAGRLEESGYDIPAGEIQAGMEVNLPCLVILGKGANGYKTIQKFLPESA